RRLAALVTVNRVNKWVVKDVLKFMSERKASPRLAVISVNSDNPLTPIPVCQARVGQSSLNAHANSWQLANHTYIYAGLGDIKDLKEASSLSLGNAARLVVFERSCGH